MEWLTKLIALSALVIGVLTLVRTWYFYDLQRRFRKISIHITEMNLNIFETTAILAARIHAVTQRESDLSLRR